MKGDRGFQQIPEMNEDPAFVLIDSSGAVVFSCRFNGRAYSGDQIRKALPWLQRGLLDSIDPPLQLVAGDLPARQIPRPAP